MKNQDQPEENQADELKEHELKQAAGGMKLRQRATTGTAAEEVYLFFATTDTWCSPPCFP